MPDYLGVSRQRKSKICRADVLLLSGFRDIDMMSRLQHHQQVINCHPGDCDILYCWISYMVDKW